MDLIRARLTGVSAEDPADTTSPAGQKIGLFEYVKADSDAGVSPTAQKGMARLVLPTGHGCPIYGGRYHFFQSLVYNPPTTGVVLVLGAQPPVIVRRDVTATGGSETCCHSIVANVVLTGTLEGKADSSSALITPAEPVEPGDFGLVTIRDNIGNSLTSVVVKFPDIAGADQLNAGSLVWLTCRIDTVPPAGGAVAPFWVGYPAGLVDHRHLRTGPGPNGGGPAFCAFAPSTVAEANALGYGLT